MDALYQAYVDNLATAWTLVKPPVTADMSREEVISTIRDCAEDLFRIHQENDRILKEILFTKTAETLTEHEAAQLGELAGALFNYNRSPDVGIAYRIHKLLYDYARYRQDEDLIIRELYYQGITMLYLNVRNPNLGMNLFIDEVGGYFRAGAAYMDRYEEFTDPQTRGYIVRCMGNIKYGLKSFQGGNDGSRSYDMNSSWSDYMDCFSRTMEVVESPRYREMNPEIPWDSFAYTMHFDRTQFLTGLRDRYDPVIAQAVLESAEYVYRHQEQLAKVKGRAIGFRTRYVYMAARYHAGQIPVEELLETLFDMCEAADLHDFSGDNIWTILYTPEYLDNYVRCLAPEERQAVQPRLQRMFDKQKEYLFLLPKNEYAMQVSRTVRTIARYTSGRDENFYQQSLDYILACHPPTFVHSKVVALVTRRFCQRMAETNPGLLSGVFGIESLEGDGLERMLDLAYHSGLYHDLGKCMLLNYVGLYSRRLLDEEFACIKLHTIFGCSLLEDMGMQELSDAAYFHHCAYDGQGGYPRSSHVCPASVRRIVDIITVVDSLDAGTDNVGRSQELREAGGGASLREGHPLRAGGGGAAGRPRLLPGGGAVPGGQPGPGVQGGLLPRGVNRF